MAWFPLEHPRILLEQLLPSLAHREQQILGKLWLFPGFWAQIPPLTPSDPALLLHPLSGNSVVELPAGNSGGASSLLCFKEPHPSALNPRNCSILLDLGIPWELPGPWGMIPVPEFPWILMEKLLWPSCFSMKGATNPALPVASSWDLEGKTHNP